MSDALTITPILPMIGAEVEGADLRVPLPEPIRNEIRAAWLKHKVLVFRDQHLTPQQHLEFGRAFGMPERHPAFDKNQFPEILEIRANPGGENTSQWKRFDLGWWHTDVTFSPSPPMGAMLNARQLPAVGGGTGFLNAAAAYEYLDGETKALIGQLHAEHAPGFERNFDDAEKLAKLNAENPPVVHPVVTVHPETGEKVLFVNEYFTTRLIGIEADRGERLLTHLLRHIQKPEFQVRIQWTPGTLVFWDERSTQHYAIKDFQGPRWLDRVTLTGAAPQGVMAAA